MKNAIKKRVRELFASGRIKGFIGLRQQGEHVAPHVFTSADDLDGLVTGDEDEPGGARYPLFPLLCSVTDRYPAETFGLLVRGCDERALDKLMSDGRVNTLNRRHVVPVGFSCPAELAERCRCAKPWPDALDAGEEMPAARSSYEVESGDFLEELTEWLEISDRCVKCFGCRNVCPVCECRECTVEREVLVPQRQLPAPPSFLLTRAVHMIDRCVYCGLCEEACPTGIPLRGLYRLVSRMAGMGASPVGFDVPPPGDEEAGEPQQDEEGASAEQTSG